MTTVPNNNIAVPPVLQNQNGEQSVASQPVATVQTASASQPAVARNVMPTYPQSYYVTPPIAQTPNGAPPSAVNIIINNPTVNPAAANVANSNNNYTYGNPNNPGSTLAAYPAGYYTAQPQKAPAQEVAKAYVANSAIKEETKTEDKKPEEAKKETEQKEVMQLTDDYIKTLENYLNSPSVEIRKMGVKELLARFKEHESRKNDVALTNLLNKALQDKVASIRFIAMSILSSGFASGDAMTINLLKNMQKSDAVYGEDANLASEILLSRAATPVKIEVPVQKTKKGDK